MLNLTTITADGFRLEQARETNSAYTIIWHLGGSWEEWPEPALTLVLHVLLVVTSKGSDPPKKEWLRRQALAVSY
jgi:hypothetical protein